MNRPSVYARSKYGVDQSAAGREKRTVNGVLFDSQKEARRYVELRMLEKSGQISNLKVKPRYRLHCPAHDGGKPLKVASYWPDFEYLENGKLITEDVKSKATAQNQTYRIKKRWMLAEYGIEVREV